MPGPKLPPPDQLEVLAEALVAAPKENANNLPLLIASLSSKQHQLPAVVQQLRLFFMDRFAGGELSARRAPAPMTGAAQDPAAVYAAWLARQYAAFQCALFALLRGDGAPRVQVAALLAAMECVRSEAAGTFNNRLFARVLEALVCGAGASAEVVGALLARFGGLADVCYHALRTLARLAERRAVRGAAAAAAAEGRQRAKWASARHQARAYSDAWLAFLRLDLPNDIYRKVLVKLHDHIIPALFNPLLLSDFLTHSLDRGGLVGMLALNGLFVLVTRHGLEYPGFFAALYHLLTPEAFAAKHRMRFFQLADVFLASGMVPAYTAAAFAKRFARLALQGSPAAALIALGFIHNIIRRHSACMQLLHRKPRAAATAAGADGAGDEAADPVGPGGGAEEQPVYRGEDVYDPKEPDPAKSRAIESSLWELEALRRHACPAVSSLSSILDKDLGDRRKTAEVDITELLKASYADLFAAEAGRRLKAAPTAFYAAPPAALLGAHCAADFGGWAAGGGGGAAEASD